MMIPDTGTSAAELLSSLVDGEPNAHELDLTLAACDDNDEMRKRWNTYHLIGDMLRSPTAPLLLADAGFYQRFRQGLALELRFVAESLSLIDILSTAKEPALPAVASRRPAANDHSFYWKLLAGFASFTAVSAIAWGVFYSAAPSGPDLAVAPSSEQVLIATPRGAMVRDARLHEWMEAHRQVGVSPAQIPPGFLRGATFETPSGNAGR